MPASKLSTKPLISKLLFYFQTNNPCLYKEAVHKVGHLLTFPCGGVGAYSRWKLIRGSALNRINTVSCIS